MKNSKFIVTLIIIIVAITGIWFFGQNQGQNKKQAEEQINIGVIFPLTGGAARYGELEKKGLELALKEVNEEGVNGKKINLIYKDSKGKPKNGVGAWKNLSISEMPAVFSSISSVCSALSPLANEDKIVLMSTDCVTDSYSSADDYTFRVLTGSSKEGKRMAELLSSKDVNNVAVVYINNAYGQGVQKSFAKNFQEQDSDVIFSENFNFGDTDFQTLLTKVKSTNPDAVYMISYAAEAENILKQMKELGIEKPIYAAQPFEDYTLLENIPKLAEQVTYITPDITTQAGGEFIAKYKQEYGKRPRVNSVRTYDALHVLAKAMRNCKQITSECIKNELYKIEHKGGVGPIDFDKNGDVDLPFVVKTAKDGEFIQVN